MTISDEAAIVCVVVVVLGINWFAWALYEWLAGRWDDPRPK